MSKKILVIAGPTGSGESTVTRELIKRYPIFTRLVTATTREPRLNEKDGQDYYFFSEEEFKKEVTIGNIIEHTFVTGRAVYYGTYKPDLEQKLNAGFNIIVNPDVVGARYYKKNYEATTIFIKTESISVLEKRLKGRDPNISEVELKRRLEAAKYELDNEESFYDYVLVNKDNKLEEVLTEIVEILQKEGYILALPPR
ncbi:MAG: Guanylate kinase [Candidatus Magasanikbacteria bacterium GW2011_GWC2_37_14]|uniref:Guanylate kinase n=1 Tax=Candidatus Magasanikbacteria bacterium GW2011_GWC2_37_14 TaxID=1619046 RepID=A0A0G0G9M0_9BACT|nr:MAG: Guanylate kinase [Candidatus Magasanikbacteria bacterium GW2011_GWC2_37_14]